MSFFEFLSGHSEVSTGISLVAFSIAGLIFYLRTRHVERRSAISKADGDRAVQLVNGTLTSLKLNTENLTKAQRFELAKRELERISRRQLFAFIFATSVALLFAGLAVYVSKNSSHDDQQQLASDKIMESIRLGSPAARDYAISKIRKEEDVNTRNKLIYQIGRGVLASHGQELCNMILGAYLLEQPIHEILQVVKSESEHQLINPVCTTVNRPHFQNAVFSSIAFVRPNFIGTDFTGATFKEAVFRDEPDYTGGESSECRVSETSYNGSSLFSSSFSGCNLSNVSFNSAIFKDVNFHQSILERVDLSFSKVSNLRFLATHLKHVDLRSATGEISFALNSKIDHLRIDFQLALESKNLPSAPDSLICISSSEANACWDLVSEDVPECRALSQSKTYLVSKEEELQQCKAWVLKQNAKSLSM